MVRDLLAGFRGRLENLCLGRTRAARQDRPFGSKPESGGRALTIREYHGEPAAWPYEIAAAIILKRIAVSREAADRARYRLMLTEVRSRQGKHDEALSLCIQIIEENADLQTSKRAKSLLRHTISRSCTRR